MKNRLLLLFIIFFIMSLFVHSSNIKFTDFFYKTYEEAEKDGVIEKYNIPEILNSKSVTNISGKYDKQANNVWFSFKFNPKDTTFIKNFNNLQIPSREEMFIIREVFNSLNIIDKIDSISYYSNNSGGQFAIIAKESVGYFYNIDDNNVYNWLRLTQTIGVVPGKTDIPLYAYSPGKDVRVVFVDEEFTAFVKLDIGAARPGRKITIAISNGNTSSQSRVIYLNENISGMHTIIESGFFINYFPGKVIMKAVFYDNDTWRDQMELEFNVVPRDYVDIVVYPRYEHYTNRIGSSYNISGTRYIEASFFVANGTDDDRIISRDFRIRAQYGTSSEYININLPESINVKPYSISEIQNFYVSFNNDSQIGDKLLNDKIVTLSSFSGANQRPGFDGCLLDWKTMKGLAADIVFVGDFSYYQRAKLTEIILTKANGYLQQTGITLIKSLSKFYSGQEIGMSDSDVERLENCEGYDERIELANFQPPKRNERLTIYIVNWLDVGMGVCGERPLNDPNTPFSCPIVSCPQPDFIINDIEPAYRNDFLPQYWKGNILFSNVVTHEICHALSTNQSMGLYHTDDDDFYCNDTDHTLPEDCFNLMYKFCSGYNWHLEECQKSRINNFSFYYKY